MTKRSKAGAATQANGRRRVPFTEALGRKICERIAAGEPWRVEYERHGTPPYDALHAWPAEHPEFALALARARDVAADACADRALAVAEACTAATVTVDRLKVSMLQWYATRRSPQRPAARPDPKDRDQPYDVRIRDFVPVARDDGSVFTREVRPDGSFIDGEA